VSQARDEALVRALWDSYAFDREEIRELIEAFDSAGFLIVPKTDAPDIVGALEAAIDLAYTAIPELSENQSKAVERWRAILEKHKAPGR
jgi:hypothetical protein